MRVSADTSLAVAQVAPDATLAVDVQLGHGAVVHSGAVLGAGCIVGAGAVVHAGTRIGARVVVEDGAVLGKRPRLRPGSSARRADAGELVVADDVTICAGAIVYAGAHVGVATIVGDQAHVRERAVVGERCVIGRASTVDFDAQLGDRVSIQTLVYITAGAIVEEDVFVGPGVTTTNDDTMGRHPPGSDHLRGPILRRACRVGGAAVLTPGVEVGEEAFIAAGAVVTRDVAPRTVVMGVPARVVRQVGDADLLERWR